MRSFTLFLFLLPCTMYGQHRYGQALIDSLEGGLQKSTEDSNKVKILYTLSFDFYQVNPDSGIKYGEQGLSLGQTLQWQRGIAQSYNSLGVNYQFKSDYPKALDCYQKSLAIHEKINNLKGAAQNISNIGMIYEYQSNYTKALEYFFKSLKINEENNLKKAKANNLVNIGTAYRDMHEYIKALNYYSQSAKLFVELGDSSAIAGNMVIMGAFYLTQEDYQKALEYYLQVLNIYKRAGNSVSAGLVTGSIGKAYYHLGQLDLALQYDFEALKLNTEFGNQKIIVENCSSIGECYLAGASDTFRQQPTAKYLYTTPKENLSRAIYYLNEAIPICNKLHFLDDLKDIELDLSKAYSIAGDYKKALEHQNNYISLKDSVFSQQNKINITNLESQRDLDLKDRDLKIADKQVQIEKLKRSNENNEDIIYFIIVGFLLIILIILGRNIILERRRSKAKINSNERKFKMLIESHSDAVAIVTPQGNVLYVSPSVQNVLGYTVEETMKVNLFTLAHPDDLHIVAPAMENAMANPGVPVYGNIIRVKHKDGNWRWAEATLTNLLHDPAIGGIVDNFRDVTERKLAEEKIIQLNRLYLVTSQINQAIVHTNDLQALYSKACGIAIEFGQMDLAIVLKINVDEKKYSVIVQNNATHETLELPINGTYSEKGAIHNVLKNGKCFVIDNEEQLIERSPWPQYTIKRSLKSGVVLPIRKEGKIEYMFMLFSRTANFFSNEELALLEGVSNDISFALDVFAKEAGRALAQKALLQSEENLRIILDLIPNPVFAKDFNGKYVFLNKSFAALFGATPAELLNKTTTDTVHVTSEANTFIEQDREVIRTGKPKEMPEDILTDYDGNVHVFQTIKIPFTFAGAGTKAVLAVARDITQQKLAEKERTNMIADIVQRNTDLQQFSYIISHNLRAPVANIIGISDLLQHIDSSTERGKLLIKGMATTAKGLDDVIKDLNNILQIKHQLNEKKEFVNFSELCGDIQLSIDNLLKREDVKITIDFSAVNGIISFKSYLYSIFLNLISNSIKYHQPGINPLISICSNYDKENNKITLIFSDNGLGIDMKKRGNELFGLYKRFHQHIEGKGMGLYMVKSQVESLGGKITVESAVNEGSTFRIEFENSSAIV